MGGYFCFIASTVVHPLHGVLIYNMSRNNLLSKAKHFWKKSVSLEPVIVIYIFSNYILTGSQITTNLLIYKTCNLTDFSIINITEEVDCTNLTWITTSNETTVMQDVNDFQVNSKCLTI